MKCYLLSVLALISFATAVLGQTSHHWQINNLQEVDGHSIEIFGNPHLVAVDQIDGNSFEAMEFDGIDDGIIVDFNPLSGATEFTAEVVFYPATKGGDEQRFVHFQQDDNNRALFELRNFNAGEWYLDTFIKSGSSNLTLIDDTKTHATNQWWHAELTYADGVMTHYVNGIKELEGEVDYAEMSSGKVSLGMRMNQVSYFKGLIKELRVTHKVLDPTEFLINQNESPLQSAATKEQFMIYPNPVTEKIMLTLPADSKGKNIRIINFLGKEMLRLNPDSLNSDIDISFLSPGIYIVQILNEEGMMMQRKFRKK